MTPRALFGLLFHADKALDLVGSALELGVLARLDAGPVGLEALCASTGARPGRMYKFMDGLESLGLVVRDQPSDAIESSTYRACEPLEAAARTVLGPGSIERDRDAYPWRDLLGRLPEVLRGDRSSRFDWPPRSPEGVATFEASMAAGCPPLIEAWRAHTAAVFAGGRSRWLDVGGGDGTLAASLLAQLPEVCADVYNLPEVEPMVRARARAARVDGRLGFVGGDFLAAPLPGGYDVISFVRVLHDWHAEIARQLVSKAREALRPGGAIVVCEEFRTPDRLAVQFFWTYFLIGADACASRLREVDWYLEVLRAAGFEPAQLLPGAFELVLARKPS